VRIGLSSKLTKKKTVGTFHSEDTNPPRVVKKNFFSSHKTLRMGERDIQTHFAASMIFLREFESLNSCLNVWQHSIEHPCNAMFTSLIGADTKYASKTKGKKANTYLFDASIRSKITQSRTQAERYTKRESNFLFNRSQALHIIDSTKPKPLNNTGTLQRYSNQET
jgi:hypothetical protein